MLIGDGYTAISPEFLNKKFCTKRLGVYFLSAENGKLF